MTSDSQTQNIREDLAFLRALVQAGDGYRRAFGAAYLGAGVCYLGQIVLTLAQMTGWLAADPVINLTVGLAPTALFLAWLTFVLIRYRSASPSGPAGRAIGAVFGAVGLANLVEVAVIGWVAWRQHSLTTWLLYPCAVCVMQGAAWQVACIMTRRRWMLAVSLVWFACAIGMALSTASLPLFIAILGAGLALGMAAPGAVMLRTPVA